MKKPECLIHQFMQFRKWNAEHLCGGQCIVQYIRSGAIHLSAPTSSARDTSFRLFLRDSSTPAPRVTRSLAVSLSVRLLFNAHGGAKFDAQIERESLHRHARAQLFRPTVVD